MTPLKAIRAYCMDCSNQSFKEVRLCVIPDCPLFQYRFGHNPKRKGQGGNIAALQKARLVRQGELKNDPALV